MKMKKVEHPMYRSDKDLWERKITLFGIISFYKYSIFSDGRLKTHYKLFKYSNPCYMKGIIKLSPPTISWRTFKEEYNSNWYTVPVDYMVDLSLNIEKSNLFNMGKVNNENVTETIKAYEAWSKSNPSKDYREKINKMLRELYAFRGCS